MLKKWAISIVVICWAVLHLSGLDPAKAVTQYIIDGWTVENGLPQSSVLQVLQTSDGYIWVGTQDGLARFDGVKFTVFNEDNTPAMTKNYIFCLFEDSRNNLWIGTLGGGLLLYKNGEFKRFTGAQGLSSDYVHCIHEDSSRNIWVGTEGGGLNRWAETSDTFTVFNTGSGFPNDVIRAVCADAAGNIWVGTEKCLCRYADGEFKPILKGIVPGSDDEVINVVYKDRRDNLWIGTDHSLYLARDGRLADHQIDTGLASIDVKHIFEDSKNTLWIATESSGLIRFYKGKTSILNTANGLFSNMVFGISEDLEGSLWLGTSLGLNRLRDGKFTAMTTREGLPNDLIFSIFEDSQGYLWIGTDNGLNRSKNGENKHFTAADGLSHTAVAVIYEDSRGFIWVGTDGGLDRLHNSPAKISKVDSYLKGEYIPAVMQDGSGDMWVGTLSGLVIIKEGKVHRMAGENGLGSETVSFMVKDRRGDIWLSRLRKGISRFTAGKFATFGTTHGLAGDSVYCMHEDADSVYWFGTDGGLSCLKDGKFSTFTKKDGLFRNSIWHILEDENGNLWMCHVGGISRVNKQDLYRFAAGSSEHVEAAVFGKDDGLRSNECVGGNQSPAYKTRDGKLWFSTVKGAAFIDPGHIPINTVIPPVYIEKVLLDDDAYPSGQQVEVQPGVKRLEFQYTALSFINPKVVTFKYRLEGYDEEWVSAGSDHKALYTNLDPGDYRFRVTAANNDGVWNETGTFIGIKVIPHYSRTWWFQVLALMVFAVLSYLLIHFTRKYITLTAFWKKQKYIGNYKLLDIIGSGGMGTIYKAQSLLDKSRTVALKVLREDMFADENSQKRFKHEAAIIDQLDHPNIVKVIERGEAKQSLFIAMEYLDGKTLTRKIKEDKEMAIDTALHIMIQIADALAKIHGKNFIHRDLKPDNVMIIERKGDPNFVKLLDFGLAKTQYQTRLTQTGVVIGTINYLAPEQVSGKSSNASGDIYSLGILFYEILTGEKPFIGETTIDIMKQIMDKTPIEPHRFREDVPPELSHLIMRMLEKDRKLRPIIYDVLAHLKTIEYTLNR